MWFVTIIGLWSWQVAAPLHHTHPWLDNPLKETLAERIAPPEGFERIGLAPDSFGSWLRHLPMVPGNPAVLLHDGRPKANQTAHFAVVDIDTGAEDLQQCADAVMRLRAEYLLASGRQEDIVFNFTSGDPARWRDWRDGQRPKISGRDVSWRPRAEPDDSYRNFRRYLRTVFVYAGTWSLQRQMKPVVNPSDVRPGDVFIQGGFPGHAVLVADVAADDAGNKVFLLLQSYMPAQQIHLLHNPAEPGSSPWYPARDKGVLATPEWTFSHGDLRRW